MEGKTTCTAHNHRSTTIRADRPWAASGLGPTLIHGCITALQLWSIVARTATPDNARQGLADARWADLPPATQADVRRLNMSPQELQHLLDHIPTNTEGVRAALMNEALAAAEAEARAQWYAAQAAMSARQAADDLLLWHRDVLMRFEFAGPKGLYEAARYENFELTSPAQRFALASVKGDLWPQPDETWHLMTLAGPPGSGKTHLAAAWFAEQTVADMHAHFIDARTLLRRLTHAKGAALDELMRHFAQGKRASSPDEPVGMELFGARHLVLDDLGADPMSAHERSLITEVIDARISTGSLQTLITTRATRSELLTLLGQRCMSQIESGPWVPMAADDQLKARRQCSMTAAEKVPLPGLSQADIDQQLRALQSHADQATQVLAERSAHLATVRRALSRLPPLAAPAPKQIKATSW